jgi:general stress protein 26
MREQKRGRRIAMTKDELDAFVGEERMCRLGSVDGSGQPHVSPLWFVWDGSALWLNSIVASQRWTNLTRDPRVSVVVDGGEGYVELRGVELIGRVEVVGSVPYTESDPAMAVVERLWGEKYANGQFFIDGKHAWLRLLPEKVVSWDFRKMGA